MLGNLQCSAEDLDFGKKSAFKLVRGILFQESVLVMQAGIDKIT